MFYYLLFFISLLANGIMQATLAPTEFNDMITFITTTDLDTATDAAYEQFMNYSERIADEGSPEQQARLETILAGEDTPETEAIIEPEAIIGSTGATHNILQKIDTLLESDIITPEVWQKKVMAPLKKIDQEGTQAEKAELHNFITTHKDTIATHCKRLINSLLYDPPVKEALKFIIVNTLIGILPGIGLKSLSILAGNLPLVNATAQLADLSVLCALDSIMRYGLQTQSEYLSAPVAAGVSTAVQDFIGFMGPRPTDFNILGATVTSTDLAMIQAAATVFAKNNLVKPDNILKIINNLDWNELAIGSEIIPATAEKTTLTSYLKNSLTLVLKNETVRSITATTVSYAVEGALIAAALNIIGLGFYNETTTAALIAGMTRGALEGLMLHASQKISRPGIVQRVSSGFGVLSIQRYLTTGIMGTSMTDLVPLVSQQLIAGAVDGVVQKTGGWKKFVTSLFAR